jgi:hypothetical protein
MGPRTSGCLKRHSRRWSGGQGYAIKTFKVNKGQCCEVYGEKDGKNVEHGFNPETSARVEK